jgi:hypothetical protein
LLKNEHAIAVLKGAMLSQLAEKPLALKGHEFTRAINHAESTWPSQAAEKLDPRNVL